jgi:uncharacterized protein YbaA (DUF1428 family)
MKRGCQNRARTDKPTHRIWPRQVRQPGQKTIAPLNHPKPKEDVMPRYVDGFVIPMPKRNLKAYRRIASMAGKIWMKHGAVAYLEGIGDDLQIKGMVNSFPKIAKIKTGETVVFSYIVYKSRSHRDRVNKKVMADPAIANMCDPKDSPFDFKRMAYGGFKALVDL